MDIHAYTSGRWLVRDKLERDSRYVSFNFDVLCKKVVELCLGAVSIVGYEKREGGFNKVFILTTDDGKRIVARLPTRISGPPRLSTNSEVATITYLKSKTTIPIPNIIDWSDDPSNAVGSEYIIMEHAAGVHLAQVWPKMSGVQQLDCIWSISECIEQWRLWNSLLTAAYTSLTSLLTPHLNTLLLTAFLLDPIAQLCTGTAMLESQGTTIVWNQTEDRSDLSAYSAGFIDAGLSRLPPVDAILDEQPTYYGPIAEHVRLLSFGGKVIHRSIEEPRIQSAAAPTLLHADLHKRNIYISNNDPTIITGLVDWQSSSIEPAFMNADKVPDFAMPGPLSDSQPIDQNAQLCSAVFNTCMKGLVPKLSAAMTLDDKLLRPFRYCHRTWRDGAAAYRDDLIQISERWKELGLDGSSPYPSPTKEELRIHQEEFASFNSAQKLRRKLVNFLEVGTDGWVSNERYEEVTVAQMEVFDEILQAVGN